MAVCISSHLSIISTNSPAKKLTFNHLLLRTPSLIVLYPCRRARLLASILTLRAIPPQKYVYPDPIPEFAEAVMLTIFPTQNSVLSYSISIYAYNCFLFWWFAGNPKVQDRVNKDAIKRQSCVWGWAWPGCQCLRQGDCYSTFII